jgi:hypothetical protein
MLFATLCIGIVLILIPLLWNPRPKICYEQIGCVIKIYPKQKPGSLKDFDVLINQLKQTNNQVRIIIFSEKIRGGSNDRLLSELGFMSFSRGNFSTYGFHESATQCELEDIALVVIIPDFLEPRSEEKAAFWFGGRFLGNGRAGLIALQDQLAKLDRGTIARAVGPHDMDSSWGPPGTEYPFQDEIGEAMLNASKRGVKIVHIP